MQANNNVGYPLIWVLGLALGCNGASDPDGPKAHDGPDPGTGTDTDVDPDTRTDTDTVSTEDSDPPCYPSAEIIGDGIDQACDGWADELGFGEPISSTGALRIGGSEISVNLGKSVSVGEDAAGETWLLVGGGLFANYPRVLGFTAPVDGTVSMDVLGPNAYCVIGDSTAVGNWQAPFVMSDNDHNSTRIYAGEGTLNFEGSTAALVSDGIYAAARDFETADLDDDGIVELVIGMGGGRVYVYGDQPGPEWVDPRLVIVSEPGVSANFGYQVGEVGDLTGDGLPEITAHEQAPDVGGRAWIFPGELTGTVTVTDAGWSLTGDEPDAAGGFDISIGDVTGDGYADLLTGGFTANERAGQSWLVAGPITSDGELADAHASFAPTFANDFCGRRVEVVPDQDGDGFDEAAIACARDWYFGVTLPGRVELFSGADAVGELGSADAARVFVGEGAFDLFGHVMTADADLTGDGTEDLVVGAPWDETVFAGGGAVYLLQSPLL